MHFCIIIFFTLCHLSVTAAWTQKANDFSCPEAHPQSRVDDEFPQSLNFTIPVLLMHFLVFYTAVHAPSSPLSPQGTAEEIKVRKASFWSGKIFSLQWRQRRPHEIWKCGAVLLCLIQKIYGVLEEFNISHLRKQMPEFPPKVHMLNIETIKQVILVNQALLSRLKSADIITRWECSKLWFNLWKFWHVSKISRVYFGKKPHSNVWVQRIQNKKYLYCPS